MILKSVEERTGLRSCWNWQTGMTKDHVSIDVRVQVSYSACSFGTRKMLKYKLSEFFFFQYKMPEEEKEAFTRNALIHSISMTYNMDDKEMENIIPVIEQVTPYIINLCKTED